MSSSIEVEKAPVCPQCEQPLRFIESVLSDDEVKSIYTCDNDDGCAVTFVHIFT